MSAELTAAATRIRTPMLDVDEIAVHFKVKRGFRSKATIRAVDGVSFALNAGETLALVGESGSGKSTIARAILRIEPLTTGHVRFEGRALSALSHGELRAERKHLQMVFQDPYGSLNPRHKIGTSVGEPLRIHALGDVAARRKRVQELLELVGLPDDFAGRHPHELSGGQRQRVAIARALAPEPRLVVCDEPVSSLDVSVQAQIINLFRRLQEDLGVAYLFIAHDLAVVRRIAHRVAVMYLGKLVETAPARAFYEQPLHPYSLALLSAVPVPDASLEKQRQRIILRGELPSPTTPPSGCRFRTRCPWAQELCAEVEPPVRTVESGRTVACHFFESIHPEQTGLARRSPAVLGSAPNSAHDLPGSQG